MNLEILRYSWNEDATLGLLFVNGKFHCDVLEDEKREIKVRGETRIPEGVYKLVIRREDTPLTIKYRQRYDFFKYHVEIAGIKNFSNVYLHPGRHSGHTLGCPLIGNRITNNRYERALLSDDVRPWKELYLNLYKHLEGGGEANIWIHEYVND